jgi:hypothetical protein
MVPVIVVSGRSGIMVRPLYRLLILILSIILGRLLPVGSLQAVAGHHIIYPVFPIVVIVVRNVVIPYIKPIQPVHAIVRCDVLSQRDSYVDANILEAVVVIQSQDETLG